jgi:hypothetical protein
VGGSNAVWHVPEIGNTTFTVRKKGGTTGGVTAPVSPAHAIKVPVTNGTIARIKGKP